MVSFKLMGFLERDDLNLGGLAMAEAHLITHDAILDRVLERGVEQHVDFLTFDEAHLDDALAKATMTINLYNNTLLSCL